MHHPFSGYMINKNKTGTQPYMASHGNCPKITLCQLGEFL